MRRKDRARARAARTVGRPVKKADIGLHDGHTAAYDPLSEAEARRIIDSALELMRDTGIGFEPDPRVLDLFSQAGCAVAPDGLVKFDPDLVRGAIDSMAKSVKLWDRAGDDYIEIDNRHTWFVPGMTAIQFFDLETGEARQSNRQDLETITRVADALPNIDAVCVACKIVERSDIHGEIDEFAAMAENTTKPLEYLCENAEALDVVIEMAAAIRGGRNKLADKPYFEHIVTPLPLYYAKCHTDQIITAVEAAVPLYMGTDTIAGASAPITIAGCLIHCLATDFAGMVLAQLVRRGCFSIGGSSALFMAPSTGGFGGFTQASLADMALCQICRILGIPSMSGVGGSSRAQRFNQDAIWQISANMMQTFYSRPASCDALGLMDEGMSYSLHALLYGHELAGMLRRMWQGIRVDDDMLAMELTRREGPRGNYLAQWHTADHCRTEMWEARYLEANMPLSSGDLPDRDLIERIDDDLREILQNHRPEPLPDPVLKKMRAIQAAFEKSH